MRVERILFLVEIITIDLKQVMRTINDEHLNMVS